MQLVPFSSSDGVNQDILDDPSKPNMRGVDSPDQFLMGMDESGLISQAYQLKQVQRGTQPASFDEEVSGVNLFLFVVNGTEIRWDSNTTSLVKIFEDNFGVNFWKNFAIVYSMWCHGE